jgi:hypothetical protein
MSGLSTVCCDSSIDSLEHFWESASKILLFVEFSEIRLLLRGERDVVFSGIVSLWPRLDGVIGVSTIGIIVESLFALFFSSSASFSALPSARKNYICQNYYNCPLTI